MTGRTTLRALLAFLLLSLVPSASAQTTLPGWAIPVLRLVSATHVEPTTGIVVSSDGLVLVPADFANESDEVVVLDGGTDIVRNGRPARIEALLESVGLELLRVDGLRRSPITLAIDLPANDDLIRLAAFPPAEQIAEGALPIWQESRLVVTPESSRPTIATDQRLPNVTGALVDDCGYLLGISIHDDVQSMEVAAATQYLWSEALLRALRAQGISIATAECRTPAPPAEEPTPEPAPESEPTPEAEPQPEPKSEPEPEPEPEPAGDPNLAEPEEDTAALEELELLPPLEVIPDAEAPASNEEPAPSRDWIWLVLAGLLIAAGVAVHLWRRMQNKAADEPGPEVGNTTMARGAVEAENEAGFQAPPMTHRLVLLGDHVGGGEFTASCAVSDQAINCVVGRGEVDLQIDSQAVSRSHARIFGDAKQLLISDLGSSNGTFVNGVPCLEGETLFIEPGNLVQLGNVRFSVNVVTNNES